MIEAWVDANVILRHLTQDPPDQARQAMALFHSAQDGHVALWVDAITIAECVWVLSSFYGHTRGDIARAMADFVTADGILSEEPTVIVAALGLFARHNVDFADALLAARMAQHRVKVVYSFDRDFDQLPGITRREPDRPDDPSSRES